MEKLKSEALAAVSEINWDAIKNKRIELQKQLDDKKIFDSAQVFAQGVKFELKPLEELAKKLTEEADDLIDIFKKKFIQAIKDLTKNDVLEKARELFLDPKTPRLEVLMRAKGSKETVPASAITSVSEFKSRVKG